LLSENYCAMRLGGLSIAPWSPDEGSAKAGGWMPQKTIGARQLQERDVQENRAWELSFPGSERA
jgi:hypothetical protein